MAALVDRKAVRLEALERDGSILFPGADRGDPAPGGLVAAGDCLGRAARWRSCASSTAPDWRSALAPSSPPKTAPPANRRPTRTCAPSIVCRPRAASDSRPAECVAVEDSHWGLESARAAGLRTIAVTHTYPASALGAADLLIDHLDRLTIADLRSIDPS